MTAETADLDSGPNNQAIGQGSDFSELYDCLTAAGYSEVVDRADKHLQRREAKRVRRRRRQGKLPRLVFPYRLGSRFGGDHVEAS